MVKNRKAQELDTWIAQTKESGIAQLKQLAVGLQRDYQGDPCGIINGMEQWPGGRTYQQTQTH